MRNHERKGKTAKEQLKEAEERLKRKNDELEAANEQIVLLRNNLARVKAELQDQQNQFFERLAQVMFEMQTQAVQDFLDLKEHVKELKDAFEKGCNVYRAQVKDADILKLVKRHMGLPSISTVEESNGNEGDEVSRRVTTDGAESNRAKEVATGGNTETD